MYPYMSKQFHTSLFIFRRDLRLEDNTGLIFALTHSEHVIPIFILTPEQIEHNPYKNLHCLKFMIECLDDLATQLKMQKGRLFIFKGTPDQIVQHCLSELAISAVIVNRDYTPYSQQRDLKIAKVCELHHCPFLSFDDALLHPPEITVKKDGTPYVKFTPYFRHASTLKINHPVHNTQTNYYKKSIVFAEKDSILSQLSPHSSAIDSVKGGRKEALKILSHLKNYQAVGQPTFLSPYLKFTVCSPREVHKAICTHLSRHHPLIRSLYWRDFFTTIAFFFPHVFKEAFHPKFNKLKWSKDEKAFKRWCEGTTGFPIVDAAMRELNTTGQMPNRMRMIVASFLIKDLHLNWQWGEQYFAQQLIDYDPCVNNGNWQWVASTGCDMQPYFRIFNPWNQQKKFDPECTYIKKWIPELQDLPPETLHKWHKKELNSHSSNYPAPMLVHEKAAQKTLQVYKLAAR